jgi:hypothetical protein
MVTELNYSNECPQYRLIASSVIDNNDAVRTEPEDGSSMSLQNVCIHLQIHTASPSTYSPQWGPQIWDKGKFTLYYELFEWILTFAIEV